MKSNEKMFLEFLELTKKNIDPQTFEPTFAFLKGIDLEERIWNLIPPQRRRRPVGREP